MLIRFYMAYVNVKFPKVPGIQTAGLARLLNENPSNETGQRGVVLLDVRETPEIAISRIPGSLQLPMDLPNDKLRDFLLRSLDGRPFFKAHIFRKYISNPSNLSFSKDHYYNSLLGALLYYVRLFFCPLF